MKSDKYYAFQTSISQWAYQSCKIIRTAIRSISSAKCCVSIHYRWLNKSEVNCGGGSFKMLFRCRQSLCVHYWGQEAENNFKSFSEEEALQIIMCTNDEQYYYYSWTASINILYSFVQSKLILSVWISVASYKLAYFYIKNKWNCWDLKYFVPSRLATIVGLVFCLSSNNDKFWKKNHV